MSHAYVQHQRNRNMTGQYQKGPSCDSCGKSAGHEYYSGPEGKPGKDLVLCGRVRCPGTSKYL